MKPREFIELEQKIKAEPLRYKLAFFAMWGALGFAIGWML